MKITLFFLLFSFSLSAQEFTIIAFNTDEKTDTITIGYRPNASLGIDNQFNEVNIFGQPVTQPVDIRVLQRDSANFSCAYLNERSTQKIFFPTNFDSKINWRNRNDTTLLNRTFELKCLTSKIKKIKIKQNLGYPSLNIFERYIDYENGCGLRDTFVFFIIYDNVIEFLTTNNSAFSNFIIVMNKRLLLDTQSPIKNASFKTYPNPFDTQLTIEIPENQVVSDLKLVDILGRIVFSKKMNPSDPVTLDLAHLKKGSYFLTLYDNRGVPFGSQIVVK